VQGLADVTPATSWTTHFESSFLDLHGMLRWGEQCLPGPLPVPATSSTRVLKRGILSQTVSYDVASSSNIRQARPA